MSISLKMFLKNFDLVTLACISPHIFLPHTMRIAYHHRIFSMVGNQPSTKRQHLPTVRGPGHLLPNLSTLRLPTVIQSLTAEPNSWGGRLPNVGHFVVAAEKKRWRSFLEGKIPILLMEEILHQLIGSLSHYVQGFIHPRWCRISSTNNING